MSTIQQVKAIILKIFWWVGLNAVFFGVAFAQRPISSFGLPSKSIDDFLLINGPNGELAFFIENDDNYIIQFLDTNLRPTNSQTYSKSGFSVKGFIMDIVWGYEGIYAYSIHSRSRQVNVISFGEQGRLGISNSEILPEEDQPLKGVVMDGNFYLLSVSSEQNLKIRKFHAGNPSTLHQYKVDKKPDFYRKLLVNEDNGQPPLSELTISHVRDFNWNFLEEGYPLKKLYTYNGRIFLIFDENNRSDVIEFESNSGGFSFNTLDYSSGYYYKTQNKGGISFPCDKYLFRFSIGYDEEMSIRAIDLNTYKTAKTLTITPRNQSRYLNGPPIEETTVNNDMPSYKTLKSYELLVKKFEDNMSLSVNKLNNEFFEIYAGNYSKTVTTQYMNNPSYYGGNGMGMGIGMGMGGMYGGGTPSYSTPYTTTTVRTLYFKTLLEASELTYMDEYVENLHQRIQGYEEKAVRSKSDGFSYIFKCKGKVIYGFFNRKNQAFNLVEF